MNVDHVAKATVRGWEGLHPAWSVKLKLPPNEGEGPSPIFMSSDDFSKLVYKITAVVEYLEEGMEGEKYLSSAD